MGEIVAPARQVVAPLTLRAGLEATAEELVRALPNAPTDYLVGALDNPRLDASHLAVVLRNGHASPLLLQRIATTPRWRLRSEVRRGLALHRNTPLSVAVGLLGELTWHDLAELAKAPVIGAELRRRCDRLVLSRLPALAAGERIALARIASEGIIRRLAGDGAAGVGRALAGNPRLTEGLLLRLLGCAEVAPGFLAAISSHPLWGVRPEIGLAVVRHPATPVQTALRICQRIGSADLRRIVNDVKVPQIVRIAAERRLDILGLTRSSDPKSDARVPGPDGSRG